MHHPYANKCIHACTSLRTWARSTDPKQLCVRQPGRRKKYSNRNRNRNRKPSIINCQSSTVTIIVILLVLVLVLVITSTIPLRIRTATEMLNSKLFICIVHRASYVADGSQWDISLHLRNSNPDGETHKVLSQYHVFVCLLLRSANDRFMGNFE